MNDLDAFHRAIYLTGPTASGKTAVGVALARALDAEVVALDSMTLYRGLDIGTAKPSEAERDGVPHHLIDVIAPWQAASVADYLGWAARAVAEIESRGRRVLFVGGTALYLKALLRGLFDGPAADPAIRAELEALDDLHERLARVDPIAAARLPPRDRRRIIRALEVHMLTGKTLSSLHSEHGRAADGVRVLALDRPRDELRDRINRRVMAMFDEGLLDEVRTVTADPERPLHPVPAQGVGYGEAIACLKGEISRADAIERTQTRTRQFAKRQRTWFRGLSECRAVTIEPGETAEATAARLARGIDSRD